ncbi:hypothetical protein N7534_003971 [Penicillium rubens]|nr:hypothetical protein N7534_003971 [Penicillium rubens]
MIPKNGEFIDNFPPFFFVDVEDVARLHIAALLHLEVAHERLIAFAGPFNRNDLIKSLQHHFPDQQFPEEFPKLTQNESRILPAKRVQDLLKHMWGKGFTSLDSLRANLEYF